MNAWTIPLALLRGVLESAAVILLVAAFARAFPRLPAGTRTLLWWLASARALVALVPGLELRLPAMAAPAGWPFGSHALAGTTTAAAAAGATLATPVATIGAHAAAATGTGDVIIALAGVAPALLIGCWILGMAVIVARWCIECARLESAWRSAEPLDTELLATLASDAPRAPDPPVEIRRSRAITVPLTFGTRRPRILIPPADGRLTARQLALAVAHERTHVRRRDLALGWLPALARLAFWFDPLVAWCVREYVDAREEACDAAALERVNASAREYGEMLLVFGVARTSAMPMVAALDSRTARGLERRLTRLAAPRRAGWLARVAGAVAIAVAAVALVPVHGAWGHERGDTASDRAAAKSANRFFYFFHRAGEKGTRGSVTMSDMDLAERLVRTRDVDFWCVRDGGHYWLIVDPEIIAHGLAQMTPMDSIEAMRTPIDRDMQDLDHAGEPARYGIQVIDRAIDSVNAAIDRDQEWAERKHDRRDGSARDGEIADLEARRVKLEAERARHERTDEKLRHERERLYQQSDVLYTQAEAMRPEIEARMQRIAREAIATGRAERLR